MSGHRTCIVVAMLYCVLDIAAITLAHTVGALAGVYLWSHGKAPP